MESTNRRHNENLKVHRANICSADVLADRQLRDAMRSRFGTQPICIVAVSSRLYRRFGESNHEHPLRLVIRGFRQLDVLVLLLQFGGQQLRCVASLRRPPVRQLLNTMKRCGSLPLVLFEDEGHRYAGIECDVPLEDLNAIAGLGMPPVADAKKCRDELCYVALSCLLLAEVPSIIVGEALRDVDVALVEEAAALHTAPTT
jgi:hypothetical protein